MKKPPVDGGGRSRQLGPIARLRIVTGEKEAAGGEGGTAGGWRRERLRVGRPARERGEEKGREEKERKRG